MTKLLPLTIAVFVICTGTAPLAQTRTVEGTWEVTAETPHGRLSLEFDLKQEGTTVSGTLLNFRGQRQPLKGEFNNGELTLEASSGDEITFTCKQKPDGSCAGHASTAQGDFAFAAVRAKKGR